MSNTEIALELRKLKLRSVRSFDTLDLELSSGLTVIVGANGVGKTNLLEAIAILCSGTSPRTASEARVVQDGQEFARISGEFWDRFGSHERAVLIDLARGKKLTLDGEAVRIAQSFAKRTPVVVFLPERLLVVRGAPARRRALIDQLSVRLDPKASQIQTKYQRAIQQRNVLLRRAKAGYSIEDKIAVWTQQVVDHGEALRAQRKATIERTHRPFQRRFADLTTITDGSFQILERGAELSELFEANKSLEYRRGSTMFGPHLDDLLPYAGERNLREFGSTGEQRASLLAFTLASADLITKSTGQEPIILLDEPWSELDAERRERLSNTLRSYNQVFCTTTELPQHLSASNESEARVQEIVITRPENKNG